MQRKSVIFFIILVLFCHSKWALANTFRGSVSLGKYHALLISNEDYRHLSPLKTPHDDTDRLASVLRKNYGFKITTIKDGDRSTVINKLDSLVERLTPNDNLLIYYAGHGHLDKATGQGYWLPSTAKPNRRSEWISNKDITDTLRAMNAKHVMVISDSCFSGTLTRAASAGLQAGSNKSQYYAKLAERRSRTAMTSGGLEPVDDAGSNGNSVFANALISALERNDKALLEGESLYNQVKRPVALNSSALQKPSYSDVRATGHDDGDFLFYRPAAARRSIDVPELNTPAATAAPARVDPMAIELSFWDTIKDSNSAADFQAYLNDYPNGRFASLARLRLQRFTTEPDSPAVSEPAPEPAPQPVPQQIAKIAPVERVVGKPSKALFMVVRATPDPEYSPEFNTREAFSSRVASYLTGFINKKRRALNVITDIDAGLSRQLLFESTDSEVSQQQCNNRNVRGVLLVELNMLRDTEEVARTPDDITYYYYDCVQQQKYFKLYSIDFQRGEEFTYSAALRETLSRFRKEVVKLR